MTEIKKHCCVVGGGPAGMMAGLLLARAGIEVLVIEKHGDFLRDFRGDTVHPSTMAIMDDLGILAEFLKRPHNEESQIGVQVGKEFVEFADFTQLDTRCRFLALMPQWEFLNFLEQQAKRYPTFSLMMNTEAVGLIEAENGRIAGVKAKTDEGELKIMTDLVIGCDGRASVVRKEAGLHVQELGAPMDVLWMRLTRKPSDPPQTLGRVVAGAFMILLNRGDYWQCGFVIPKGQLEAIKSKPIEDFRQRIKEVSPFLTDRVEELRNWDAIKLLTVRVDRLNKWYRDGLLCIGDAAHAMSPVGGVGINLAIQDAVAAANILWRPLSEGRCTPQQLEQVEKRRLYPTRMMQRFQLSIQNAIVKPTLQATRLEAPPLPMRLFNVIPTLRRIPATIVGLGFRPERVHSPDAGKTQRAVV